MSADTTPISPARFAAALKDLSVGMLHLKVLEIRNSIAHLQFSNDQLKPFAEGSATPLSDSNTTTTATDGPDQDCVDAIRENELVIDRMAERIVLIRDEVEARGQSWTEFQSKDEVEARKVGADKTSGVANGDANNEVNGHTDETAATEPQHSAWTDGTFQVGIISGGRLQMDPQPGQASGGTLSDEQLRAAMEERMRNLNTEDEPSEGGMHL